MRRLMMVCFVYTILICCVPTCTYRNQAPNNPCFAKFNVFLIVIIVILTVHTVIYILCNTPDEPVGFHNLVKVAK